MVTKHKIALAIALATGVTIAGCGGGDQANSGGETGDSISGVITAFGSVYVNGVKYNTDSASFTVNGQNGNEDDLKLGMVVNIEGYNNGDGTGSANSISFNGQVEGPVSAIAVLDSNDNNILLLEVFGIKVALNERSTYFDNSDFATIRDNVTELTLGEMVELSGYYDAQGTLQVTYFQKEGEQFISNESEIELIGMVSNLSDDSFDLIINSLITIRIDSSNSEIPDELVNGVQVEVEGFALDRDSDLLVANDIDVNDYDEDQEVELQGLIQDYNASNQTFSLNGMKVDVSNAELDSNVLVNDNLVEVEGNVINNILVAKEVEFLDDHEGFDYEFRAQVEAIDVEANTITFNLSNQDIKVTVDNRTVWQDEGNEVRSLNLSAISLFQTLDLDLQNKENGWYASKVERISIEIGFKAKTKLTADDVNVGNKTVNVFGADVPIASYAEISDDLSVDEFLSQAPSFEEVELEATQAPGYVIDKISIEN